MRRAPAVNGHVVAGDDLSGVTFSVPSSGLVLGLVEDTGLVVRMFRAEPVRVCVISTGPLAQLLALRALALGAHVTVITDEVNRWSPLVAAVPGGPSMLAVLPSGARVQATGSMERPSLVIDATSDHRALPRWEQSPWQTFVSVQPDAGEDPATGLRAFDLVVTQRLGSSGAEGVRRAFGLAQDRAAWLTQMPPYAVAVAARGQLAFGQLRLSTAEQRLFGG